MKKHFAYILFIFFSTFLFSQLHSMELLLEREKLLLKIEETKSNAFLIPLVLGIGCASLSFLPLPKVFTLWLQQNTVKIGSMVASTALIAAGLVICYRNFHNDKRNLLKNLEKRIDNEITYSDRDLNELHQQLRAQKNIFTEQLNKKFSQETKNSLVLVENALQHYKAQDL